MHKEAKEQGVKIGGIGPIGQLIKPGSVEDIQIDPITGEVIKPATPPATTPKTDPPAGDPNFKLVDPSGEGDADLDKFLGEIQDDEIDSTLAELEEAKTKLLARKGTKK